MATLTLKQVPDDLYQKLKERAATHRRSLNNEAIHCLEQMVQDRRLNSQEWLEEARALRRQTPDLFLTEEALRAAKDSGRP
jgi:plasmid stability protein